MSPWTKWGYIFIIFAYIIPLSEGVGGVFVGRSFFSLI